MKLSNTLTRKKEEFKPIKKGKVGVYSCGPTVYWNQHVGHMYAYVQWDTMVRFFRFLGNDVEWVVNITDVGHMTSDEDIGEDKMEKGAKREGISVWDLAEKYTRQFEESLKLLNISQPDVLARVTKHIKEQIDLVKRIQNNDFTYQTKMGLVFDTSKFKDYTKFANLKLDKQEKRKDVKDDPEKKLPWDFFLWVTGNPKHVMKWDSPWGEGYPGWHIECTSISTKYLGENFDIHTGGIEHIGVHHTNEIAQGIGAFGMHTANYWLHNAWLTLKDEKMSKSLGNMVTVQDLVKKGYDPMHFRYLVLTSHYRKGLTFSYESLDAARRAYQKLAEHIRQWRGGKRKSLSKEKLERVDKYSIEFIEKVKDDLNYPEALATLWKVVKSNIPNEDKLDLVLEFDQVLGLSLSKVSKVKIESKVPKEVKDLLKEREQLRKKGDYKGSDKIREKIENLGYTVVDTKKDSKIKRIDL